MSTPDPANDVDGLLHELRLRGWVERDDDAAALDLVHRGFARRQGTRVMLTPEGREAHAVWARVPEGSEPEMCLANGYEQFLELNVGLVRVCTDWQLRPGNVPNDHSDVVYDWAVIDRLTALDERAGPVVERLASALERLRHYRPRLRGAADRVKAGEHDWFLSPRCDSYHTVWMQLHEDLLLALGRDRATEEQR